MTNNTIKRLQGLIPFILGLLGFAIVAGPNGLDPTNIGWLDTGGDLSLHYLSWDFFRHGPWTFPLGMNPDYGIDISSSIVYSDSIPIFAFIFKLLSPLLSEPFQYFGIWYFCCFILQAYFAWLLLSLLKPSWQIQSLGTLLFVFAPPFLIRVGFHASFSGQFLILAALYLSLRQNQKNRALWWILLIAISALINGYILFMGLALFIGSSLDLIYFKTKIRLRQFIVELIALVIILILFFWVTGYFVPGASGGEFGIKKMNLLAPILPGGWAGLPWSYFYNLPAEWNHFEGFNYFGIGVITLIFILIFYYKKWVTSFIKIIREHLFLIIVIGALACFALSNKIAIGGWEINIPLSEFLLNLVSTFRASGRMFWPAYYAIIFFSIYLSLKIFNQKNLIWLLSFICLLQIGDTSAGWREIRTRFGENPSSKFQSELTTLLVDPFWDSVANKYHKLVVYPIHRDVEILPRGWNTWAYYAATHRMATNSIFLGRYDDKKIKLAGAKIDQAIMSGQFDPDTLYIFDDERILPVLTHLDRSKHLFARIDGFNVLAPNWKTCSSCKLPLPDQEMNKSFQIPTLNTPIDFSKNGHGADYLLNLDAKQIIGRGWSWPEEFGVWSEGSPVQLVIPLPNPKPTKLIINCRALITQNHPSQSVQIFINTIFMGNFLLENGDNNILTIDIPKNDLKDYVSIEFKFPANLASPKSLGMGDDERLLGIRIKSITFN
ncbi:DUF6311 domain-containing protein [Polynucleobacter sp. IMCC30063]|uniref:DUF6311 domain-containing protein n=1 Tax=Polynucleobacter sp. IMCC30063 TaxID=2907298 RepID=UPI001F2532BD|nr:DUF6311 domain-containing protein [Polynucleobacter sp. IMCC30063]MCE7505265.1 DUF6311 domain-containing protein [Polynucleobacter sp. IMCC30063]